MENAKTRILQKVLPRVNHDNVDITIGVEDVHFHYSIIISKFIKKGGKGFA